MRPVSNTTSLPRSPEKLCRAPRSVEAVDDHRDLPSTVGGELEGVAHDRLGEGHVRPRGAPPLDGHQAGSVCSRRGEGAA